MLFVLILLLCFNIFLFFQRVFKRVNVILFWTYQYSVLIIYYLLKSQLNPLKKDVVDIGVRVHLCSTWSSCHGWKHDMWQCHVITTFSTRLRPWNDTNNCSHSYSSCTPLHKDRSATYNNHPVCPGLVVFNF